MQDDQVKGPLRVRILYSLQSEMMNRKFIQWFIGFYICRYTFKMLKNVNQKTKLQIRCCRVSINYNITMAISLVKEC